MRLLTWNLRHGGGRKRTPGFALALVELDADIIVLTEFQSVRGAELAAVLRERGWVHQLESPDCAKRNGVLFASRLACSALEPASAAPITTARMPRDDAEDVVITGAYIPPADGSDPRAAARHTGVWQEIRRVADRVHDATHVILGDLNTPRPGIDTPSANRAPGLVHLGALAACGYRDPARPEQRAERTWSGPRGAEARLDVALVRNAQIRHAPEPATTPQPTVRVVADPALGSLSDHFPVLLKLPDTPKTPEKTAKVARPDAENPRKQASNEHERGPE